MQNICVLLFSASVGLTAATEFESPFMVEAAGKPIAVTISGYTCPTFSDVDGDGKMDLVVGQYSGGKLTYYKNVSDTKTPKFAKAASLMSDGKALSVPGVW